MIRNKKESWLLASGVALLTLFAIIFIMCNNAQRSFAYTIVNSGGIYFALFVLYIINIYLALQSRACFWTYISVLFAAFSAYAITDRAYSPIDECAFFDCINHLIDNGKLITFFDETNGKYLSAATLGLHEIPSGINYEAVQAPLYIMILAAVGYFVPSGYIRLRIFRLVSLGFVFIAFIFLNKTIRYLEEKKIFCCNEKMYRLTLLVTIFSPAYLLRASRLNNEILVCVLMAVLLYISVRCVMEGYSKKHYWLLSLICVALFMTKNTAVYAYVLFGMIVLYQRKLHRAIIPGLAGVSLTIPWFIFNYRTYGTLTAMKEHLDCVIPIVNPEKKNIDLFDAFFSVLPGSFFSGEELPLPYAEFFWVACGFAVILILIVDSLLSILSVSNACAIKEKKRLDPSAEIKVICLILIASAVACLLAGTITTKVCSIRGRYLFGPCIVIVLLMQIHTEKITAYHKKWITLLLTGAIAIASARATVTFLDKIHTNEHLFGYKVEKIWCEDLSDENWKHGVSNDGNYILLKNDGQNYSLLRDQYILIDGQDSVITDVQLHGNYIWLGLSENLESSAITSNEIALGGKIQNIPIGSAESIIPNVQGLWVTQEICYPQDYYLEGFSVIVGTYHDLDYDAGLCYQVLNKAGDILTEGKVTLENMVDNAYAAVYFERSPYITDGEQIQIRFLIENEEKKPIALYISENNISMGGNLFLEEECYPESDASLVLITRCDY